MRVRRDDCTEFNTNGVPSSSPESGRDGVTHDNKPPEIPGRFRKKIKCRLFPRLREDRILPVGPILGGGYLESGDYLFNIVACRVPNDEFGASWWCYPAESPIKDAEAFYRRLARDEDRELEFVAHAIRGFSWLIHELFIVVPEPSETLST